MCRPCLSLDGLIRYLQALATVPVSSNCIEVMHLLTLGGYVDDDFFLHIYISNIIRSAEMMPEGPRKDTHVRMVNVIKRRRKDALSYIYMF